MSIFWVYLGSAQIPKIVIVFDLFLQPKKILVWYDGKFFLAVFFDDLRFHTSTDKPPSYEESDK